MATEAKKVKCSFCRTTELTTKVDGVWLDMPRDWNQVMLTSGRGIVRNYLLCRYCTSHLGLR